jgi:FAD/FMN-containing dehydrogenase
MSDDPALRGAAAAQTLRSEMTGNAFLPGDDGYDAACRIWNGAVTARPALVAICETRHDVQAAVRAAGAYRLPLSVRGGGHDWVGRALRDGGLVVDLTRMRAVTIDTSTQTATVQGGATSGDVISAAAATGLAPVVGIIRAVGMAGLTLGGGYSPVSGRYGHAVDNLLGVEMVLADGRAVTADESQNPDLFWAVRGGGGNFGAVTSMRIQLHPVTSALAGAIVFPWSQARQVLRGQAEILSSASDNLGIAGTIATGPDGSPVVVLSVTWVGDPAEGEPVVDEVTRLGAPLTSHVEVTKYADLTKATDVQVVDGRHVAAGTRSLRHFTPDAITAIITATDARTSPLSLIGWQYAHGAASRVPVDATAFAYRDDHFHVQFVASWTDSDPDAHRKWVTDLSQALAPHALPGGYANLLAPENLDQIADAYGPNLPRLQRIKREFDPDGVFTSAIPLPGSNVP